jgi:SAM-dependent methyltransferase
MRALHTAELPGERVKKSWLSSRTLIDAGAAVTLSKAQQAMVDRLTLMLERGELSQVSGPCVCRSRRDVLIADVDRFGLNMRSVLCLECGTVRSDPYLDEESLQRFYTDFYQELYERSDSVEDYSLRQRIYGERVRRAIPGLVPKAQRAVEVGCGAGGALSVLAADGLQVAGCDHSARLIAHGRASGLSMLVAGDLQTLARKHPQLAGTDVIFLHHVLEHLSNPTDFLRFAGGLLQPNGAVLAIVPDIARIDRFPFPGGDVRLFFHIAHKYNFSRAGLRHMAEQAGLEVEFLTGFEADIAPEIWAVFSHRGVRVHSRSRSTEQQESPLGQEGPRMLRYLRNTELRYLVGLLPGKGGLAPRVSRLMQTVLPSRVDLRLRRSFRWVRRSLTRAGAAG